MLRFAIALAALIGASASASPIDQRGAAQARLAAQDWPAAAAAYRALVAADPDHGGDWYRLGEALARQGDCAAAAPAFARAIALGVDGGREGLLRAHVAAARCAAAVGDLDGAISHLAVAQARYGYDGFASLAAEPQFAALAADPRFRRLAGQRQPNLGRAAAWRADLDYYVDLVLRRHPNPFRDVSERAWRGAAASLRARTARLDDVAIVAGFMRLAALIGDGHTNILPPLEGPRAFHLLPIRPYRIGGDWYVAAAAPAHRDLVGARIVAIGGHPIVEVERGMRALLAGDNDRTIGFIGGIALQFFELAALTAGEEPGNALALDLVDQSGARRRVLLRPGPIDRNPTVRWAPAGWPTMAGAEPPLWLAHADSPFVLQTLDDGATVYAQVNTIADGPDQSFAQFAAALGARIAEPRVRRLVIDLRHNNGGDGGLNWILVREIVRATRLDREGGVFVIIGSRTFSAAMGLASMLETHASVIFVGEPTGSRPNFYGEDTPFTLPHSRLTGSISSAWFQGGETSDDLRPFIAPDLPAPLTPDALRTGRDPALEAVAAYAAEHQE
jgi:hypothetical protein